MSYSDIVGHHSMVFDRVRNAAYAKAMENIITSESRVMDLGAGLGILGLMAAKLGAAEVHLVEPAIPENLTAELARHNGLEQVTCHEATGEALNPDIEVDVILSVFTGNFLLTEDLLPSLFRARDKFLAPGGKLIPDRARMVVVPVSAPDEYNKQVKRWDEASAYFTEKQLPPVDFGPIGAFARNTVYYNAADAFAAKPLANERILEELDLYTATEAACDARVDAVITEGGVCHGWLGWFDARMGEDWLSTGPQAPATHWSLAFMPLAQPIEVKRGDNISLELKRPELGEWTWSTRCNLPGATPSQRQSTFLSRPFSPADIQKRSQNYQPTLNNRGEALQWLLANMTGELNAGQLARMLQENFTGQFPSLRDAENFVRKQCEDLS
ncbi:50S ribosomal protein L11 methyltransferase [Halioglobus maricola]|nr:50S ribosomal protein L11 methyltransferase [Halioglobus maricola]